MSREAERARKAMLANLRSVVKHCTCEWPLTKYRNGHGHHDECPAVEAARLGFALRRPPTTEGE